MAALELEPRLQSELWRDPASCSLDLPSLGSLSSVLGGTGHNGGVATTTAAADPLLLLREAPAVSLREAPIGWPPIPPLSRDGEGPPAAADLTMSTYS